MKTSSASSEEPEYYRVYGTMIARYTALLDKQEKDGLTGKEEKELNNLKAQIPAEDLQDWMMRRAGNFAVNKYLLDLVKEKRKPEDTRLASFCLCFTLEQSLKKKKKKKSRKR